MYNNRFLMITHFVPFVIYSISDDSVVIASKCIEQDNVVTLSSERYFSSFCLA